MADQRDVDRIAASDPVGIDVHLDQRSAGPEPRIPAERAGLVERGAHGEQHVDAVAEQELAGGAMTGETEHAERQLVILGKHALPARRGRDPRRKQLGQQAQVLGRPGHRGPGAGQDHRSVSGPQRLGRGLHRPVIGAPRLAAIGRGLEPVVAGRLPPDLDRHVEVHRPGTPREREAHAPTIAHSRSGEMARRRWCERLCARSPWPSTW